MDEISTLIKEAKPLYYKNKAIKEKFKKAFLGLFLLLCVGFGAIGGYNLNSKNLLTTTNSTNNTTTSEDSPFPVDEYGLITVAY
jgi:hypothetical protein